MTDQNINLRVPGPTPVPEEVARAGARPMVNHRGPEFAAVMSEVVEGLKPFFGTTSDPLLLTCSGTGGLEAAIVNMLSPGDEVLSVTGGVFGDRFADIAQAFGATVRRLQSDWGTASSPIAVADALQAHPGVKAVLLTHNETSTGVTNDVLSLVEAVRRDALPDRLVLVDGVSSIGALPFSQDGWDVDVAITGSQKAWMSPPGLTMIGVSERAWDEHARATMPRFYLDFSKARKNADKRTTPFTPAVGVVRALQQALQLMSAEGLESIFARHRRIGERLREGVGGLGLELFAEPSAASDTVTAVRVPAGTDASRLIGGMRKRGVVVASGQEWLKGAIFRVGHMGFVDDQDIDLVLAALRGAMAEELLEKAV
jgi:aspartate aminotransferase-like enzyme